MNADYNTIIAKAKLLGRGKTIQTVSKDCYLIKDDEGNNLIIIPDNVTEINKDSHQEFTNNIKELTGKIKVIGGRGLKSISNMFFDCKFDEIDLSGMTTSNVIHMNSVFQNCVAREIILNGFDTSKCQDMYMMFAGCISGTLDLSSFTVTRSTDIREIFLLFNKYIDGNLDNPVIKGHIITSNCLLLDAYKNSDNGSSFAKGDVLSIRFHP